MGSGQLDGGATNKAAQVLPQPITVPNTRAVIFLVVTIKPGAESAAAVRNFCGNVPALVRSVGSRVEKGELTCILGIGSQAWDRLFGSPRPAELHEFREIRSGGRIAPSTPGDLLFHIRADRMDQCFELATHLMAGLGDAVKPEDEVQAFRYFDRRSIVGFVDGTENPSGVEAEDVALIGDEDGAFAGGSYVIVQKYLHDMQGWNALPAEMQEKIIGRKKLSDVELDDATKPSWAHNALTVIEQDGVEKKILRDNMPFGRVSEGEFGTYFIGYSRSPQVTELMLENMFVGRPPGNYDRLLDFSRAVTGGLFFIPTRTFLESISGSGPEEGQSGSNPAVNSTGNEAGRADGSLGIGDLKGDASHE